jgi:hypothetical protein
VGTIELHQARMALLPLQAAIDTMGREREQARTALEGRLQAALFAVASLIVPRAEHGVLAAAATLLACDDLRPERALLLVEARRRQLESALGDVDALALEAEAATIDARRLSLLELAGAGIGRVALVERDPRFPALQAVADGGGSATDVAAARALLLEAAHSWSAQTPVELLSALRNEKRRLLELGGEARVLASAVARLKDTARRRRQAEAGLRALDDEVLAWARTVIGRVLAAHLRERAGLPAFDAIAARLAHDEPASRRVLRAARIVAASLRYVDAAWARFVEPLARRVNATLLQLEVGLQEPGGHTEVEVPANLGADVQEGGLRFVAVLAAALGFHEFDKVHDDDVLWDRICGGDATRAALGRDADGGFLTEVREARARAWVDLPTLAVPDAALPTTLPSPSSSSSSSSSEPSALDLKDVPTVPVARLGRYRLERRLGHGGMAEVYLAVQDGPRGFSRRVVVKRILAEHADDPYYIAMFQREASVIARLHHPNIVDIYELGVAGDVWFMAMELLEGLGFNELLRRGPLDVACIACVIADAAAGLAYAHERGVVHRDVSPDNLYVTRSGCTKVIDFGIACRNDEVALTQVGELKGKIPFMAPELLQGEVFDGKVDVFALGVSLWSALVGRRPWGGDSLPAIMRGILTRPAEAPSRHRADIPAAIDELVLAMLAASPAQRPTAEEVVDRLLPIAVDHSVIAALPALQERGPTP